MLQSFGCGNRQLLVSRQTGQMGTGTKMDGYRVNQDLTISRVFAGP
jgi:hypothetical protein